MFREDGQRGAGGVRTRTEGEHEGQMGQNCATAAVCRDLMILRYPDIPPPTLLTSFRYPVASSSLVIRTSHGQYSTVLWGSAIQPRGSPRWDHLGGPPHGVYSSSALLTEAKTHNRGISLMQGWS
jgi:hypothetical protein